MAGARPVDAVDAADTVAPVDDPLAADLRASVRGDVLTDDVSRGIYATDASFYQIVPAAVVVPVDADDVVAALRVAHRHRTPVTVRGAATSLSGQTQGPGVVIDVSRHLDRIIALDPAAGTARVQPGVILDQLNSAAAAHGLLFAPDPATSSRATIGGMIANNSSGTRSIIHGKTIDHVLSLRVALADGTVLDLDPCDDATWAARAAGDGREAELYRGVGDLVERHRDEIVARFPKVMRRVSGYNLDELVDGAGYTGPIGPRDRSGPRRRSLADLVVGSEGTLAVVLEATVRLVPRPVASALCVVHFDDLLDALRAVPTVLGHDPSAVELLDDVVLREAIRNPSTADKAGFFDGNPAAVLICEVSETGDPLAAPARVAERIAALAVELEARGIGYAWPTRTNLAGVRDVWEVRKLGLGLISNVPGPVKGQAFIEDACVPVEALPDYIAKVLDLCARHELAVSVYAHASVGVLHVRPMLDLHLPAHREVMGEIAEASFRWVHEVGGTVAGEHGDGIVRGAFIRRAFGDELYGAFRELKALFDPEGLLNPNKIVETPAMTDHLRYGDGYEPATVPVRFHHRAQGGFVAAIEQCNGVGACRKIGSGTMCPSYMATRDEETSTRGRANALRLAVSGQFPADDLASDRVAEVLSLCLACKACARECPNEVDMARLKADVLQLRHDAHGTPLAARLVGGLGDLAPFVAGPLAPIANAVAVSPPGRWLLERVGDVDRRRTLPPFAREPLRRRLRSRPPVDRDRPEVVLVDDVWSSWFEPHIGEAAVELLESCGYRVTLASDGLSRGPVGRVRRRLGLAAIDSQRPRISKGLVDDARRRGERVVRALARPVRRGVPVVCLEPSDASAIVSDLPDLIGNEALGREVAAGVSMIERFVAGELAAGRIRGVRIADRLDGRFLLHGHCHQKALFGTADLRAVWAAAGADVTEVDAGCCGMAGSFGYEHHDVSVAVAEDRLLPAVRAAVTDGRTVVACGTSCRAQVADLAGVTALHWVETIRGT
ncbi:MAG: FAD-binding and (Fe-S)-binding domain-containing protein [Actinomycetota bacterium]|nr:FAD-binding and (Fe-S)-binding domain-containing protein [Actinomycetota bacterium]